MGPLTTRLRQVLRRLGRASMFTAIIPATLAIVIGANTAIFSVLEGALLKPLPYPHPEELVAVWLTAPGINFKDVNLSPSTYFIFREQSHTLQDIGVTAGYSLNVTGRGEPERVSGLAVTDGVLPTLGVTPVVGRLFTRVDDSPGSADTVILTYRYWQTSTEYGDGRIFPKVLARTADTTERRG